MILDWKLFTESNDSIYFYETDIYRNIVQDLKIPNSTFDDFLSDLKDDYDMEYTVNQIPALGKKTDEGIPFLIVLKLNRNHKVSQMSAHNKFNTQVHNRMDMVEFESFLRNQINIIDKINESIDRLCKSEDIIILKKEIDHNQFHHKLDIWIKMEKMIITDKFNKAEKEFNKTLSGNALIQQLDIIIKKLVDRGISEKDAKVLVDLSPDYAISNIVLYGFHTDDEIIDIAYYNKTSKKLEIANIEKCIRYYYKGYCKDVLLESNPE